MKITIDTSTDSPEDIRKAIRLLQEISGDAPMVTSSIVVDEQSSSSAESLLEDSGEIDLSGVAGMFDDDSSNDDDDDFDDEDDGDTIIRPYH